MSHSIRIGFVRRPDGSAEPVCEPPVDAFLLILWGRAAEVVVTEDRFVVVGTVGGAIRFEGTMRPIDLFSEVSRMAREGIEFMGAFVRALDAQYPFDRIAESVIEKARPQILLNLDQPFVETEAPAFVDNGRVMLENPRVEFDDGRLRVVVTGNPEDHPMRVWADGLIRERTRDAILAAVLRDASVGSC